MGKSLATSHRLFPLLHLHLLLLLLTSFPYPLLSPHLLLPFAPVSFVLPLSPGAAFAGASQTHLTRARPAFHTSGRRGGGRRPPSRGKASHFVTCGLTHKASNYLRSREKRPQTASFSLEELATIAPPFIEQRRACEVIADASLALRHRLGGLRGEGEAPILTP